MVNKYCIRTIWGTKLKEMCFYSKNKENLISIIKLSAKGIIIQTRARKLINLTLSFNRVTKIKAYYSPIRKLCLTTLDLTNQATSMSMGLLKWMRAKDLESGKKWQQTLCYPIILNCRANLPVSLHILRIR